jgi:hypothetical protein
LKFAVAVAVDINIDLDVDVSVAVAVAVVSIIQFLLDCAFTIGRLCSEASRQQTLYATRFHVTDERPDYTVLQYLTTVIHCFVGK